MSLRRFVPQLLIAIALIGATLHVGAQPVGAAPGDGGPLMYGVNQYGNDADYGDRGFQPIGASGQLADGGRVITLTGEVVDSAQAIAVHPLTDVVYAIVTLDGTADRLFVTLDPSTGAATAIGTPTIVEMAQTKAIEISSMVFDDAGTLYAISGEGGGGSTGQSTCRACLLTVNTNTAATTKVAGPLGTHRVDNNDAYGESIAFDSDNDLIYHVSGYNADRVFETIDPGNSFARSAITMTGDLPEAIQGFTFDPATDTLYASDWNAEFFTITPLGVSTFVSEMYSWTRGLVVVQHDDPVAVDDAATFSENQGTTFIDVLENDIDGAVTPVGTVQSVSDPANGTAVVQAGGIGLRYEPDSDECFNLGDNTDTFTYTLDTGSVGTVKISIPCPEIERTITMKYVDSKGMFKGKVSAPDLPACAAGGPVRVMKVTSEGHNTFLNGTTEPDGTYKIKKRVRRGTFYAIADFFKIPNVADCDQAESPEIKVK